MSAPDGAAGAEAPASGARTPAVSDAGAGSGRGGR